MNIPRRRRYPMRAKRRPGPRIVFVGNSRLSTAAETLKAIRKFYDTGGKS